MTSIFYLFLLTSLAAVHLSQSFVPNQSSSSDTEISDHFHVVSIRDPHHSSYSDLVGIEDNGPVGHVVTTQGLTPANASFAVLYSYTKSPTCNSTASYGEAIRLNTCYPSGYQGQYTGEYSSLAVVVENTLTVTQYQSQTCSGTVYGTPRTYSKTCSSTYQYFQLQNLPVVWPTTGLTYSYFPTSSECSANAQSNLMSQVFLPTSASGCLLNSLSSSGSSSYTCAGSNINVESYSSGSCNNQTLENEFTIPSSTTCSNALTSTMFSIYGYPYISCTIIGPASSSSPSYSSPSSFSSYSSSSSWSGELLTKLLPLFIILPIVVVLGVGLALWWFGFCSCITGKSKTVGETAAVPSAPQLELKNIKV